MSSSTSPSLHPADSTPTRANQRKRSTPSKALRTSGASPTEFTPEMQDAQARGKDPYEGTTRKGKEVRRYDGDSGDESDGMENDKYNAFGFDNYERTQQRRAAAMILDNPELIMMHALARGDSIPATRHHFMKMMCGYLKSEEIYQKPGMPLENDEGRLGQSPRSAGKKSRKSSGIDG